MAWVRSFLLVAVAVTSTVSARVEAQSDAERAQARVAFQSGVEHYGAERYEEALRAFQEAYRIAPHPSVRVNMANCYERLGRFVEALDHFQRFLVEAEGASAEQQREVRAAVRRLRGRVGEVFFRVEPDGAQVAIAGTQTRTAPILESVALPAGRHRIEVSLDGYQREVREVEVTGGGRAEVRVSLEVAELASPAEVGTERVDPATLDEGSPALEASTDPLGLDPSPAPRRRLNLGAPTIAAAAGTVVMASAALALGLSALAQQRAFDDAVVRSNDPSLSPAERAAARQDGLDADRRASRRSTAADVLGVTAVLAAGATVFLLLRKPGTDEGRALRVAPSFAREGGGLLLDGRF